MNVGFAGGLGQCQVFLAYGTAAAQVLQVKQEQPQVSGEGR